MTSRGLSRTLRAVSVVAGAAFLASPAVGATTPGAPVQGVPLVANPPAGYPYPNTAVSPPSAPMPDASGAAAPEPAASGGAAPAAPQVDPTSKAPNTYGQDGPPPRLNISTQAPDTSPTMKIGGSFVRGTTFVSLRALGLYRHDDFSVFDDGSYVPYGGVALQFLPGVSSLVRPAPRSSDSLIALAPATLVVVGRDGARAIFHSQELIDAAGNPRVYLVDRRMGVPLGAHEGPFRLVSPHDKNESRWIRDVVDIEVNR